MSLISYLREQYGDEFREYLSDDQKIVFTKRDRYLEYVLECNLRPIPPKEFLEKCPISEKEINYLNEDIIDYSYYFNRDGIGQSKNNHMFWFLNINSHPVYKKLCKFFINNSDIPMMNHICFTLIKANDDGEVFLYALNMRKPDAFVSLLFYAHCCYLKNEKLQNILISSKFLNNKSFTSGNILQLIQMTPYLSCFPDDQNKDEDGHTFYDGTDNGEFKKMFEEIGKYNGGKYSAKIMSEAGAHGLI